MKTITYPTATELDTEDPHHIGWSVDIYFDPKALEFIPFRGVGNKGTPAPAWHNRWAYVTSYGPNCVGASILEALQGHEDLARDVAETYLGSEWNGNNNVGRWNEDAAYAQTLLQEAVQDADVQYHAIP